MMLLIGIVAGLVASIIVSELEIRHMMKLMDKNYLLRERFQELKMEIMLRDHY